MKLMKDSQQIVSNTGVSVSILTFLGMVIVNKVPHYRVTKLEPHTTDTQVRSGQLQFCHPNSEAPIIARKAIPKLTEMDKLPVLNTSVQTVGVAMMSEKTPWLDASEVSIS